MTSDERTAEGNTSLRDADANLEGLRASTGLRDADANLEGLRASTGLRDADAKARDAAGAPHTRKRPEVLAPAGDEEAMRAAVRAGADAVYFGLPQFNARARAANVSEGSLDAFVSHLHEHGVRAYVALNTLVFDAEIPALERAVRACAAAGVDAVIVQDLGVARLVRAIAPSLPVHASTQMTCTDAGSVELARSVGATRVILARELSVEDVRAIREGTDLSIELEVFVHGALCVSYSGQCLTSEAIGGRSANRGACAQSCRLPYELVVDGEVRDLGERAYLLSPQDLEASALVPALADAGVVSVKIEGRLKGPAYVTAATRLYRAAVDGMNDAGAMTMAREDAAQMYSRGAGPGFLGGVDHQRLVEGVACDHRGLRVGVFDGVRSMKGRAWLRVQLDAGASIARGDGVLIEGGRGGEGELGGRVWAVCDARGLEHERVEGTGKGGGEALAWLGPEKERAVREAPPAGRRLWKTDDPAREKGVLAASERAPHRVAIDVTVRGRFGEKPVFEARTERGIYARVEGEGALEPSRGAVLPVEALREKLGRLGESPFALRELRVELPEEGAVLPLSWVNRARRSLVEALLRATERSHATTERTAEGLIAEAVPPADREPAPAGLFVLCRTEAQARAAIEAGADGVYLDFLELTGAGSALRALRSEGARFVGVAPPRIRKPGEEKIDRYLASLQPDGVLVRGLGALYELSKLPANDGEKRPVFIGDFSLNVTNRVTAAEVLSRGLSAFTPGYDLDAAQVTALVETPFGPWAELVVHHPMPLFHMEHCVFAALLSQGKDYRDCGRPCEKHALSLRDRAGMEHPVEADVGCRNTVFHAAAQSGAGLVAGAQRAGVKRFRVELVRESAEDTQRVVRAYRALLAGTQTARDVWRALKTEGHYGVVRGSLRVLTG